MNNPLIAAQTRELVLCVAEVLPKEKPVDDRLCLCSGLSMQPGDVLGQALNLAVVQLCRHTYHLRVVLA